MSRQVKKVNIGGKEDKSNKVTGLLSNSNTDSEYPSAKSVVDTLDDFNSYVIESFATKSSLNNKENIINKSSSITTDTGSTSKYPTVKAVEDYAQPKGNYLTQHQSLANYVQKSNTSGLLKNDGNVDTTQYLSSLPSHNHDDRYYTESEVDTALNGKANSSHTHTKSQITDFPTIPSASSTVPSADTTNGSYGSGTSYARSNHTHPKSSLYAEASHTHSQYLTSHQDISGKANINDLGAVALSNDYDDLDNKPTIPTSTSHLTNDSGFLTSHQSLSGYLQTSDVKDNLTSTDTNKPLSAKQGKELKTLVDGKANSTHTHYPSNIQSEIGVNVIREYSDLTNDFDSNYQGNGGGSVLFDSLIYSTDEDALFTFDNSRDYSKVATLNDIPNISGKEDSSNKVSSWNSTTNNIRYPTEKLVKDSLDGKADNNHTHEVLLSSNDDSDIQLFNVSTQGVPQGEGQSLGAFLLEFWKKIYPIGSIYMNANNVDPAILFGGQWEPIEDMFLLASGSTYGNGTTGGSADATLVSHQHGTSESGEYFVTSEANGANNTRVAYSSSGSRYVDGMTDNTTPFHHRVGTGYVGSSATGKNMPPYLAVNVWKRIA